jgi:hypothetical protein
MKFVLPIFFAAGAVVVVASDDVIITQGRVGPAADAVLEMRDPATVGQRDLERSNRKERILALERMLNFNEPRNERERRLAERRLLAEIASLKRATRGTPDYAEVVRLERIYLIRRNAEAGFAEGRGSPTGAAGRFEGAALVRLPGDPVPETGPAAGGN